MSSRDAQLTIIKGKHQDMRDQPPRLIDIGQYVIEILDTILHSSTLIFSKGGGVVADASNPH